MKSPARRTRDIERQAGYLKPEHCAPPPPRSGSGTMWFIRDGCGIVCGVITWFLVFYAEFVVVFVMLLPAKNTAYSLFNGVIFNGLAFLALASHAKAMCTDPVSHSASAHRVCVVLTELCLFLLNMFLELDFIKKEKM